MSKDNFATPLTRFFRVSACKATALHHLFQNKKLFNCLHKLSNGIDCAKNCPTRRNFAPNLHCPWFFNAKHKLSRFATVYVPARRLYEFDILRRFAMLNARQTHNFFVHFSINRVTKTRTKTAESITQNGFEDNACLQYFDETRKRFRTNIDVWKRFVFVVCAQVRKIRKYRSKGRTRPQNGKTKQKVALRNKNVEIFLQYFAFLQKIPCACWQTQKSNKKHLQNNADAFCNC